MKKITMDKGILIKVGAVVGAVGAVTGVVVWVRKGIAKKKRKYDEYLTALNGDNVSWWDNYNDVKSAVKYLGLEIQVNEADVPFPTLCTFSEVPDWIDLCTIEYNKNGKRLVITPVIYENDALIEK